MIFPVALAAYYGFYQWKGYGEPTDWVGLNNYKLILTDSAFHDVLWHNGLILVLSLVIQGPLAIGVALLLNQRIRGRSAIRVLIFVPYIISEVIVGTGWSLMLQSNGAVNDLLRSIGLGSLEADWIADPDLAIWTLMAIITWKYIGFAVILMLAGLQSVPDEIFEAAQIDGASYWQIQRRITLPLLGPTIRIWAFLSIIGSLQLFDLVYIIWGQYVSGTAGTSTMAIYLLAQGRNAGNYGYGSAVAVVMFVISLAVACSTSVSSCAATSGAPSPKGPCDERDDHHPRRPSPILGRSAPPAAATARRSGAAPSPTSSRCSSSVCVSRRWPTS